MKNSKTVCSYLDLQFYRWLLVPEVYTRRTTSLLKSCIKGLKECLLHCPPTGNNQFLWSKHFMSNEGADIPQTNPPFAENKFKDFFCCFEVQIIKRYRLLVLLQVNGGWDLKLCASLFFLWISWLHCRCKNVSMSSQLESFECLTPSIK